MTSAGISDLFPRQYTSLGRAPDPGAAAEARAVEDPAPPAPTIGLPGLAQSWRDYAFLQVRSVILPIGAGAQEQSIIDAATKVRWGQDAIGLVVLAICGVGLAIWFSRDGPSLWLLFLVAYLVAVLVWPWSLRRYLYVVQPQIYLMFLLGSSAVVGQLSRIRAGRGMPARSALGALVGVLILAGIYSGLRDGDSRLHVGDLHERSAWLNSISDPRDVLMTEEPEIDAVYTGLHTLGYGPLQDADEVLRYAGAAHVSYVLVAPIVQWQVTYIPEYSWRSLTLLAALDTLIEHDRASSVFVSDDGWIRGFRLSPRSESATAP
jgi:hypothetical protein